MSSLALLLALAFPFLAPPAPVENYADTGHFLPVSRTDVFSKISTPEKVVALTLDDGPSPRYTPIALQVAQTEHIPLTFFLIGQEAVKYPELVLQEQAAGHVIGNHTWHHPLNGVGDTRGAWEVHQTQLLLLKITGQRPTLFRPPGGELNTGTAAAARADGLQIITWNVFPGDTDAKLSAEVLAKSVLAQVRPGSIILMHDGGGHRDSSMAALPVIVKALKAQGYSFVTVPDLLKLDQGQRSLIAAPGTGKASELGTSKPAAPTPSPPVLEQPSVTLERLP
ncbi:polysaccharide deacetylase family protein [Deinococcus ruber]|uniref:Polysaccharide deacetylase n=1 Tax=Deinococcus ruber TaxID=1848197 RepID=A0A918CNG1_9DEIO|nr:polysaccharide deacetylase family protein [Deinococcus ruber]GGR30649.1 polysaccharide deacetylase [Deinococcus ruber]